LSPPDEAQLRRIEPNPYRIARRKNHLACSRIDHEANRNTVNLGLDVKMSIGPRPEMHFARLTGDTTCRIQFTQHPIFHHDDFLAETEPGKNHQPDGKPSGNIAEHVGRPHPQMQKPTPHQGKDADRTDDMGPVLTSRESAGIAGHEQCNQAENRNPAEHPIKGATGRRRFLPRSFLNGTILSFEKRTTLYIVTPMKKEQAETIALQAVAFIGGDERALRGFLAQSGMDEGDLKAALTQPEFLAGVLDYILSHEPTLTAFCDQTDLPYDLPARARRALPGGDVPDW